MPKPGERPVVNAADLSPEVRRRLGLESPRTRKPRSMTMHDVRSYAIRALNTMADLSQAERARVLKHAVKVNDV